MRIMTQDISRFVLPGEELARKLNEQPVVQGSESGYRDNIFFFGSTDLIRTKIVNGDEDWHLAYRSTSPEGLWISTRIEENLYRIEGNYTTMSLGALGEHESPRQEYILRTKGRWESKPVLDLWDTVNVTIDDLTYSPEVLTKFEITVCR